MVFTASRLGYYFFAAFFLAAFFGGGFLFRPSSSLFGAARRLFIMSPTHFEFSFLLRLFLVQNPALVDADTSLELSALYIVFSSRCQ